MRDGFIEDFGGGQWHVVYTKNDEQKDLFTRELIGHQYFTDENLAKRSLEAWRKFGHNLTGRERAEKRG